jgi:RNA polymerase-binding transcription factor DksA
MEEMAQMIDVKPLEAKLLARRDELKRRLGKIETDLDRERSADSEERATEGENDEVLEGLGLQGQIELTAIEAALKRVEDGSYGICVRCAREISGERLEAVPHAALCRNCMG